MAAMDLNDFSVIKEGEVEILMHSKNVVFYNKAQVNHRDMSIAIFRAFIAKRKEEHAARLSKKKKKKKTGWADSEAAVSVSVEEEDEEENEEGGDEPAVKKTKIETDSEKDVSKPGVDEASTEPAVNGNCTGDCEMSEDVSLEESSSVTEEPSGTEQGKGHGELKPLKVLEALSASGLRALRYAREVEGIGQVVALDNDKASIEACRRNIKFNGSVACSKNSVRHLPNFGPVVPQNCTDCGKRFNMGGPLWSAPIHDQEWVTSILSDVKLMKNHYPSYNRKRCILLCLMKNHYPAYIHLVTCVGQKMYFVMFNVMHGWIEFGYYVF